MGTNTKAVNEMSTPAGYMTDEEVRADWGAMKERQTAERHEMIVRYLLGRTATQVSMLIGVDERTVREAVDRIAAYEAITGGHARNAHNVLKRDELRSALKRHANKTPPAEYVREYQEQGHAKPIAQRMAKAYAAIEDEVAKGRIRVPDPGSTRAKLKKGAEYEHELRKHMGAVLAAAQWLTKQNTTMLSRKLSHEQITKADKHWREAVDVAQGKRPSLRLVQ